MTRDVGGLGIRRELMPLDSAIIDELPAQLGVYELVDSEGATIKFGYAGGRTAFGIRTALEAELSTAATGTQVRHEFTMAYLTRFQELLMAHAAEHGDVPPGNAEPPPAHHEPLGRLARRGPTAATGAR